MVRQVWPQVGHRIGVRVLPDVLDLTALVDHVEPPDALTLREPYADGGATPAAPPPGRPLRLSWTTSAGYHELSARLLGVARDRVPVWELAVDGGPTVLQRREYVRVPDALAARVSHDDHVWDGIVCDLSEGGARCVLLTSPEELAPGQVIALEMTIEDRPLAVQAELLALDLVDAERAAVRMRFVEPGPAADVVRRRVLQQQRKALAMGVRSA